MWLCKHTVGRQCSQKGAGPEQSRKICLTSYSSLFFLCLFWPSVRGPTTFCWLVCGSVLFHFVPVPYVDLSSRADSTTWKLVATCHCEISVTFCQIQDITSQNTVFITCWLFVYKYMLWLLELGCLVLFQTNVRIAGSVKHYGFYLLLQSDILYYRKKFVFFLNIFSSLPVGKESRSSARWG
jgi:hypothetical protein